MLRKRLLAVTLTMALLVSILPNMAFAAAKSDNDLLTRGEVVETLLTSAKHYHENLQKSDIIKGYDGGDAKENQPVTRVETFAMVSRAFGQLPTPVGNDKRIGLINTGFTDVPSWAQSDVSNLANAGVIAGTAANILSSNANVTKGQLDAVIHRIWALEGSNLKDDFYNAINKKTLDVSTIPQGQASDDSFSSLEKTNSDRLTKIVNELLSKTSTLGSSDQKISDFYRGIADTASRDSVGITPISEYLTSIDSVTDLSDLYATQMTIRDKTGTSGLIGCGLSVNQKDSTQYILAFGSLTPNMPKEFYTEGSDKTSAYLNYLSTILVLSGETKDQATKDAKSYYELEKAIAKVELTTQESSDIDKVYNLLTPEQVQKLIPSFNIKRFLKDCGYRMPDEILVGDIKATQAFASYFTNEHIDLLKTATKIALLEGLGGTLSSSFQEAGTTFSNQYLGIEGTTSAETRALNVTENYMGDYLEQIYVKQYFSEKAKDDVTSMANEFISIFKERIQKLDWMSDSTKKMAIKKLGDMKVKVGYPDETRSFMDSITIKYEKGQNSFYDNICTISRRSNDVEAEIFNIGQKVNKTSWALPAFSVNAYYNPYANEIVFPAGILQAPFYDVNASKEQNLGSIGVVMAHEITHAFDDNGAKYDENGNLSNWWTDEDYTKFQALCDKAAKFYDGYEVAPGIKINGQLTLSENIADNGGMACALDAMAKLTNPDYKKFFESNAKLWYETTSKEYLQYLTKMDTHSPNKARVNLNIVNFDVFYKTYDIQEGDGMYVAPEDRIKIW